MQTTDLLFVRQAYEVTLGQPYPLKQLSPKRVLFPIPGRWHHASTKAGVLNISARCLASDRFRIDSSDAVTVCGTPLVFPAGLFRCGCCFRCCMCFVSICCSISPAWYSCSISNQSKFTIKFLPVM